jgi:hypothetical protein
MVPPTDWRSLPGEVGGGCGEGERGAYSRGEGLCQVLYECRNVCVDIGTFVWTGRLAQGDADASKLAAHAGNTAYRGQL